MDQRVKQYGVVSPETLKSNDGLAFLQGIIARQASQPADQRDARLPSGRGRARPRGVRGPAGIPPLQSDRHRARRLCRDAARFRARLRDLLDAARAKPGPRSKSSSISCAPMTKDTGPVRAEGRVIHRGRTVATSEGDLKDARGQALCPRHHDLHDFPGEKLRRSLVAVGRERRPQRASGSMLRAATARRAARRVMAGEVAIGKAEPRDRAAETVGVGALEIEAGLDRQPAQRGADRLAFHLQRAGRQHARSAAGPRPGSGWSRPPSRRHGRGRRRACLRNRCS